MLIANIALFFLVLFGCLMIFSGLFPRVSPAARRAVLARAGKKDTLSVVLLNKISVKLLPHINLDKMKRQKLEQTLIVLGRAGTPELFHAQAWANGIVYFLGIAALPPILHLLMLIAFPELFPAATLYQLGLISAIIMVFVGRNMVLQEIDNDMRKRQEAIEWELPQFSGTILQSLSHTRNVLDILTSYKKICGSALDSEIEKTLNDMKTGNHEQAIKNLAARVNSGAFTQLAQGLIGMLRGDDQTSYFQIITNDFYGMQNKLVEKELLSRPGKLTINNVLLLVGMVAMFIVAIGGQLMDSGANLF